MELEEVIGSFLGELIGRHVSERFGSDVEGLRKALEYLYSWEKDFKLEVEDNTITSQGLCPIKNYYPRFCEKGCIAFIEGVAKKFNAKVERLSTEPICKFRFTIK